MKKSVPRFERLIDQHVVAIYIALCKRRQAATEMEMKIQVLQVKHSRAIEQLTKELRPARYTGFAPPFPHLSRQDLRRTAYFLGFRKEAGRYLTDRYIFT